MVFSLPLFKASTVIVPKRDFVIHAAKPRRRSFLRRQIMLAVFADMGRSDRRFVFLEEITSPSFVRIYRIISQNAITAVQTICVTFAIPAFCVYEIGFGPFRFDVV